MTRLASALAAIAAVLALAAPAALAAPRLNLDMHHAQTNAAPGGQVEYWFEVENTGDADTTGTVSLKVTLPNGITRYSVRKAAGGSDDVIWSCPGAVGDAIVECTTTEPIPRHLNSSNIALLANVSAGLPSGIDRFAKAQAEGGGAAAPSPLVFEQTHVDSSPAGFEILPETFLPDFHEADGIATVRGAGSHPDRLVVPFDFSTVEAPIANNPYEKDNAERVRDLTVDLPPGFIGNPTTVGECPAATLISAECPRPSQVGVAYIRTTTFDGSPAPQQSFTHWARPIYNIEHPRGAISDLAFIIAGNPIHIYASLDPANRYAIRTEVPFINETLPSFEAKTVFWGIPADSSHDSERCDSGNFMRLTTDEDCSSSLARLPFLTVPAQCESDNTFRLHHYDSWDHPGVYGPEIDYTIPGKFEECDRPRFEPEVEIEPTGKQANTPTGLDVHVKVAQNENPNALASPPVKRFTVRLPDGMSFSPSFADGLQSCTLAQMQLGNNDPVQCPDASRIGEVELHSPLLPKQAEGSMYLAAQQDNPYGSTFALLLVLHDTEERGILVKIPGRIDVDPNTGQITTVFEDTPQFPFDDLTLKFRSGPRAPLVSPPSCGTQTIGIEVASYAQPQKALNRDNTYEVTEGPNGTPCPPDENRRPFSPDFSGGTLNPVAGAYSPFLFRLSRSDDEQELTGVKTVLPPGLVGKIAGKTLCPDQAIQSISTAEFAGAGGATTPPARPPRSSARSAPAWERDRAPTTSAARSTWPGRIRAPPLEPGRSRPGPGRPLRPRQRGGPRSASDRLPDRPGHGDLRPLPDDPPRSDPAHQRRAPADRPPRHDPEPDQLLSDVGRRGDLRGGGSGVQRAKPLPGRLLRLPGLQAKALPQALRRHQAGSLPQAQSRSALPRRQRQHGKGLGGPAPLGVPRTGPHRHPLHQGAVRRQGLPQGFYLRHGQGQEPAA